MNIVGALNAGVATEMAQVFAELGARASAAETLKTGFDAEALARDFGSRLFPSLQAMPRSARAFALALTPVGLALSHLDENEHIPENTSEAVVDWLVLEGQTPEASDVLQWCSHILNALGRDGVDVARIIVDAGARVFGEIKEATEAALSRRGGIPERTLLPPAQKEKIRKELRGLAIDCVSVPEAFDWTPDPRMPGIAHGKPLRKMGDGTIAVPIYMGPHTTYAEHLHLGEEYLIIVKGTVTDHEGSWSEATPYRKGAGSSHAPRNDSDEPLIIIGVAMQGVVLTGSADAAWTRLYSAYRKQGGKASESDIAALMNDTTPRGRPILMAYLMAILQKVSRETPKARDDGPRNLPASLSLEIAALRCMTSEDRVDLVTSMVYGDGKRKSAAAEDLYRRAGIKPQDD